MIKKRSAKKIVSPLARCLTDGDKAYEHEFVDLPKRRKLPRAAVIHQIIIIIKMFSFGLFEIKFIFHFFQWNSGSQSEPQTVENSPMPSSPFALPSIPSTPIRSPTYATHKLPSFKEMISSHKSSSFNTNNNHLAASVDKDESVERVTENPQSSDLIVIPTNDETLVPATLAPIGGTATVSETNNITVTGCTMGPSSLINGTVIDPYIAKNPNLTYKANADDIMSMDIIFDNVPIEEDPTIGNNMTIIHDTSTPSVATENIHYEIIELNGSNQSGSLVQHQLPEANYSQLDDSSNDGILVIDETVQSPIEYNDIVIDSNDVVIVSSPALPPASSQNDVAIAVSRKQSHDDENTWPETTTRSSPNFIQSTPDKPEEIEIKQKRTRRPKTIPLNSETAAKPAETSQKLCDGKETIAASSTRKRKPLPALIGRNKKSKKEISQPVKTDTVVGNKTILSTELDKIADTVVAVTVDSEPSTSSHSYEQETQFVRNDEDADDKNDTNDSDANNFMNSLVVVESQDPNDPHKTIHEVYVVCPETKKMSDQPLDLPDAVIQRIRLSMMPEAE